MVSWEAEGNMNTRIIWAGWMRAGWLCAIVLLASIVGPARGQGGCGPYWEEVSLEPPR